MNNKENGTGKNNQLSNEQLVQVNGGKNNPSREIELREMAYEAIRDFSGEDLEMRLTSIMGFVRQYYESGLISRGDLYVLKYCTSEALDRNGYGDLKQYVFYPINDLV